SVASMVPMPGVSVYGMTKAALEHFTLDAARELHPHGIAVNCFRIDVPVASEGLLDNSPDQTAETFEPVEVATEGQLWMLRQPLSYTGQIESMWDLRINLSGPFYATHAVLPNMLERRWGRIINISSMSSGGAYKQVTYGATKVGLIGLTRAIASEFAPAGITANAVLPGLIGTAK